MIYCLKMLESLPKWVIPGSQATSIGLHKINFRPIKKFRKFDHRKLPRKLKITSCFLTRCIYATTHSIYNFAFRLKEFSGRGQSPWCVRKKNWVKVLLPSSAAHPWDWNCRSFPETMGRPFPYFFTRLTKENLSLCNWFGVCIKFTEQKNYLKNLFSSMRI